MKSKRGLGVHFLAITISALLPFATLCAAEAPLWTEWKESRKGGAPCLLPDFSYAGYAHGEKPIPDVKGPIFKVEDFGAVAGDAQNDSEAIQKAVEAAEAAGGGVVLFQQGVYLINDREDDATNARVRIRKSGVVLRGAGCGEYGTILSSPSQMQPENPNEMWSGRCPIVLQPEGVFDGPRKAKVVGPAPMNSLVLNLEAGHPFKAGDRLILRSSRKGEAAAPFVAPHPWDPKWTSGIAFRELHEVAAVDGERIHLAEPLMATVDEGGAWKVQEVRFLSNFGFEDLRFQGNWKESFSHHRSWRDDSAWRGLSMAFAENGWVRRVVFADMCWAANAQSCRQLTLEDVDIIGTPAHFGFQATGTYGVLGIGIRDTAGHHHGPSLQGGSCATVYHRCTWAEQKSFDSHANNPYATLHDRNRGGMNLLGVGGSRKNFPHHLHGLVLWNLEVTAVPKIECSFWTVGKMEYPVTFAQVLIAGLQGEGLPGIDEETILRNECKGEAVDPPSLWLAQLKERLGKVPAHFARYAER